MCTFLRSRRALGRPRELDFTIECLFRVLEQKRLAYQMTPAFQASRLTDSARSRLRLEGVFSARLISGFYLRLAAVAEKPRFRHHGRALLSAGHRCYHRRVQRSLRRSDESVSL